MDGRAIYDFGWGFDAPLHTLIDSIEVQRRYVAPYTNSENFPQLSGYYATSGGWPPQPLGEDAIESCLTASVPLCAVGADTWMLNCPDRSASACWPLVSSVPSLRPQVLGLTLSRRRGRVN